MTQAICRGDAEAAAGCFAETGVYHDGFYGEFKGRAAIADMVRRHFHGDASDFSSEGRRAGFSGICKVRLKDGLIERYEEIFERAQVLARLGFADERILKSVRKWAGV